MVVKKLPTLNPKVTRQQMFRSTSSLYRLAAQAHAPNRSSAPGREWRENTRVRDGPALSVHGLTKRFGDRVAFQDLSFEIAHGEVLGFLGPNGAGKTTTVRTLGTLLAPTSGSATVAGLPLTLENGIENPAAHRDHA